MVGATVTPKLRINPDWFFRWRPRKPEWLPGVIAVSFAGVALALLMTVRIRVVTPELSSPRAAAVTYLRDDSQGRELSARAQEGGPFPARFYLTQWEGLAAMESSAMEAARVQPEAYVSPIRELPAANQLKSLELASKGKSFFPQRTPAMAAPMAVPKLKLAPALYPLAGISRESLPLDLPPFGGEVDSETSSSSWRFLVRLNPEGVVVGLHPGTVESALSQPFQSGLADGQLTAPQHAAANLLGVLAGLTPAQSGRVFDFRGDEIPA